MEETRGEDGRGWMWVCVWGRETSSALFLCAGLRMGARGGAWGCVEEGGPSAYRPEFWLGLGKNLSLCSGVDGRPKAQWCHMVQRDRLSPKLKEAFVAPSG